MGYAGPLPNYERDTYKSVADMVAAGNAGKLDTGHICYITDEKKHYKWTDDGAVPFGGSSIIWGPGFKEDADGTVRTNLASPPSGGYRVRNVLEETEGGVGVFVHYDYFNGYPPSSQGGPSPLTFMPISTEYGTEGYGTYGLALVLSEDFTTVPFADGTYGLALAAGAGGGGSTKVDPEGGLKYDSLDGLGIVTEDGGCLKTEYGIGLSLKLDTYSCLTVESGYLKLKTPGPGLAFTQDYGLSLHLCTKAHSGLHYPEGSDYGLAINLSDKHLVGTAQSNGNPLVLDASNGLTLNLDNTLKVTNGKLGVAELPSIDVTWTNGIGQLDGADSPVVGLKMGDRAGLAVSDDGNGSLHVQLPDEKIVDSAVNGSLGDWCGDYTQADTINAGGGLLRGKYGLALYLDTNYFKSAEPSEYGWGPTPITLDIAAIAQAVASVINASI